MSPSQAVLLRGTAAGTTCRQAADWRAAPAGGGDRGRAQAQVSRGARFGPGIHV